MPIYEYRCGACGHELEVLQKLSEAPLTECPSCGQSRLSKLISAAGFQLKGTGWYATDFKNSGKPKSAGKKGGNGKAATDAAGADSSAKSDSAASDSATAAKSDTKASTTNGDGCGPGCSCH
jgi:putative FmdB family regulatory protein